MSKILVIGAGIGQLYLAKKIKQQGHHLIVVSLPGDFPVIPIADKVYYEDIFNKEGVLAIARNECIDAVLSDQNDLMMPTVAYVAENMGLPGNGPEIVNSYCNKNIYRENCDKLNIPVPRHAAVNDAVIPEKMKKVPFPWIVKPADSQSSVGVSKVNNPEEYAAALSVALEKSKTHSAIIEEFFDGQEIVAEGFIYKGKYYNLGFADRKYFDLPNLFIPSQTLFPSIAPSAILEKISDCEIRMAEFMKPEFAIVHSEYLYNPTNGEIRVVESALRGGGVYISSHLVPLYSGIDINDVLLECALGKLIDMDKIMLKRTPKASGYVCFYLPVGEIVAIEGLGEICSFDFVKMASISEIKMGETSHPLQHKGQRSGPIILTAENRQELERKIRIVKEKFHVFVKDSHNMVHDAIWK